MSRWRTRVPLLLVCASLTAVGCGGEDPPLDPGPEVDPIIGLWGASDNTGSPEVVLAFEFRSDGSLEMRSGSGYVERTTHGYVRPGPGWVIIDASEAARVDFLDENRMNLELGATLHAFERLAVLPDHLQLGALVARAWYQHATPILLGPDSLSSSGLAFDGVVLWFTGDDARAHTIDPLTGSTGGSISIGVGRTVAAAHDGDLWLIDTAASTERAIRVDPVSLAIIDAIEPELALGVPDRRPLGVAVDEGAETIYMQLGRRGRRR